MLRQSIPEFLDACDTLLGNSSGVAGASTRGVQYTLIKKYTLNDQWDSEYMIQGIVVNKGVQCCALWSFDNIWQIDRFRVQALGSSEEGVQVLLSAFRLGVVGLQLDCF